ncbi:right-handed parallel beta-helix repeat-containing protein [Acidicapsa acidisoli]|uniref:right-handed parallel beta-helix repeat-containing protein n=1 Tax=Acidicapsa acidisoli TaxID=1615681 RepID=UPI0021E08EC1|nr:right-handed parallel beta-helix repeat-containing protein [Acidicapsa acidisoli]
MPEIRRKSALIVCCASLFAVICQIGMSATLCVNQGGSSGCYSKIQSAVSHASANDVIEVRAGTYKEDVVIGIPLSLIGAGAERTIIDATGLENGIFVDGYDNPGLRHVTVAGFTVENAQYEAVLVVSASDVTVRDNRMIDNDKFGPVFSPVASGCAGQPAFETDENGDCGGALHFIGVEGSIASGNLMTGNADGILLSDETAETHDNLIIHNTVKDNPLDCGIVLASHPPVGSTPPHFAPHFGVDHNTIAENISADNGVKVGGAGVGLFSDGNGPGRASDNVIIHNSLTGNGIGGVSLHTHVGPAFGAPADNMDGNMIIGNYVAGNLADVDDTATPGRVGININSGGGGSPVWGTIISQNVIRDEDVDIAVNTPGTVDAHLNDLLGGHVGVANICAFDGAACTGHINVTENYWGCAAGPGWKGCTTTSGTNLLFTPWLHNPVADDDDGRGDHH